MGRRRKSLEELQREPYLTKTETARYLGVPMHTAVKVFNIADEIDRAELPYRVEVDKARKSSILRAYGVSEQEIEKKCGS